VAQDNDDDIALTDTASLIEASICRGSLEEIPKGNVFGRLRRQERAEDFVRLPLCVARHASADGSWVHLAR